MLSRCMALSEFSTTLPLSIEISSSCGILTTHRLPLHQVLGVWSTDYIPKGTRFGPLKGHLYEKNDLPSEQGNRNYLWPIYYSDTKRFKYLDAFDVNKANWMRFVSGAESVSGQNLVACQVNNQIYFYTVKAIMPDQELLVWYCKEFAERLNYSVNGELMEKKIRKSIEPVSQVEVQSMLIDMPIDKPLGIPNDMLVELPIDTPVDTPIDLPQLTLKSILKTVRLISLFILSSPSSSPLARRTGEQLLSERQVDSSSSIKRENRRDSVDADEMLMGAPCPSSLIKESLKHSLTARLSLNHPTSQSSEASPLENLSLAFSSSIAGNKSTTKDDSANLLSNVNNSHNNANSNGK